MNQTHPIIDTHLHLWNPQRILMPWIADAPGINRAFALEEYRSETADLPLAGMIYVEVCVHPAYALVEAQQIAALAAQEPQLLGMVAHAPLEDGDTARSYLDALAALGPVVKGVRRNIQDEADAAFCLRPDFVRGVHLLAEYGWSFDICCRHWQLANATELVRRCPNVQFVLDHIGKPAIAAGTLDPWRNDLAALAALPNVACKLSGMVTEADHATWTPDHLAPYVMHALDVFGAERVLYGGDWPVSTLATTLPRWASTLATLTAGLSDTEQQALWAGNARRVYRVA